MIIFRHHRGGLAESMATKIEFKTFEDLQKYIVEYMKPYMNLQLQDIVPEGNPYTDDRIGWYDVDHLCIAGYNDVSDKEGFELYFGGKYEHPLCIGMFATDYDVDKAVEKS